MRRLLQLSLLANLLAGLLLLGALIRRGVELARHAPPPAGKPFRRAGPQPEASAPAAREQPRAAPSPFSWRQIESTDYSTYIANLRSVGCPEQTIRDLITADVGSLYAAKRAQMEEGFQAVAPLGATADASAMVRRQAAADALRAEEAAVLLALLGPGPEASGPGGPAPAPNRAASAVGRYLDGVVGVPLSFQSLAPGTMDLNPQQQEVLAGLRRTFATQLELPGVDHGDPAYRQRWQAAQRENDDLLRGMLGTRFFLDYQLHAAAPPPPSP